MDEKRAGKKFKVHMLRANDRVYSALYAMLVGHNVDGLTASRLADGAADGQIPLTLLIKTMAETSYNLEEN